MTRLARREVAFVMAAKAEEGNFSRLSVHLVTATTSKLPLAHFFRAFVRIVGVDHLSEDYVAFRPPNNLLVTCVLVGHMALKADFVRVLAHCQSRGINAAPRMNRLHGRSIMAIQTCQILLSVETPKHVRILH